MNPPSHPLEAPHPLHPSIPLSAFQCDEIEEGNGPGSPKRDRKGQTNVSDEIKIDGEQAERVIPAPAPAEMTPSHPLEPSHPLDPSIPLDAFQCDELQEPGSRKR
eukprot:52168_1